MCGIAGAAWTSNGKSLAVSDVRAMIDVLQHRGPDDWGILHSDASQSSPDPRVVISGTSSNRSGVSLGHRRLSIIDLDSGRQPVDNEDSTVWTAFNGEIYNYRELRADLESRGHKFKTNTDTEVIVHLYEDYGVDFVDHLKGMFAISLWDAKNARLVLVRDRIGQKPLFYRCETSCIVFASELKALLQLPDAPRELNPAAIDQFLLYQYVPHPTSILKGYSKLAPAHRAVFENGELKIDRYWSPPYSEEDTTLSTEQWQKQLRETLTEAVRLRMRSDVPLGCFLSGGIDSTIITGLMQQLSHQPIHTFSIGFPVKQFDERTFARMASDHLGTKHHEQVVEPEALKILPKLIWHYDEPFGDSSAIPTMYLSEMTRNNVTVALSGDAGDELFAGYNRYQAVRIGGYFDALPGPLRALATAGIWQKMPASVKPKSFRRRVKRLLAAMRKSPERRYLTWIGIFDEDRRPTIYSDEFRQTLNGFDAGGLLLDAYQHCPDRDFVTRTTCADLLTYLPCDILTKVDIASMTHSLECRSPFLDHEVVELAARMPMKFKLRGKLGKRILIETFDDLLPEAVWNRRKMGFGVPLDRWFRNELKPLLYDMLLDPSSLGRGYFRPDVVESLVNEHVEGRFDHSARLWALLCLEMWHRTYLDPSTAPSGPITV